MDFSPAAILVAYCFEARTKMHIAHLKTKIYAEHKALDEFYTAVVGLADGYAECWQGRYGIITEYPRVNLSENPIPTLKNIRKWIDDNYEQIGPTSELKNIVDEIQSLINSTLYKIENLS